jgi:hypothetical protein
MFSKETSRTRRSGTGRKLYSIGVFTIAMAFAFWELLAPPPLALVSPAVRTFRGLSALLMFLLPLGIGLHRYKIKKNLSSISQLPTVMRKADRRDLICFVIGPGLLLTAMLICSSSHILSLYLMVWLLYLLVMLEFIRLEGHQAQLVLLEHLRDALPSTGSADSKPPTQAGDPRQQEKRRLLEALWIQLKGNSSALETVLQTIGRERWSEKVIQYHLRRNDKLSAFLVLANLYQQVEEGLLVPSARTKQLIRVLSEGRWSGEEPLIRQLAKQCLEVLERGVPSQHLVRACASHPSFEPLLRMVEEDPKQLLRSLEAERGDLDVLSQSANNLTGDPKEPLSEAGYRRWLGRLWRR